MHDSATVVERRRGEVGDRRFRRARHEAGWPGFVPPAERIATFDNDGTLWCEQPMQVQIYFALDRLKELVKKQPEMKERQPYKAFLEHDMKTIASLGKQAVFELAFATHAGLSEDEFMRCGARVVRDGEASEARPAV